MPRRRCTLYRFAIPCLRVSFLRLSLQTLAVALRLCAIQCNPLPLPYDPSPGPSGHLHCSPLLRFAVPPRINAPRGSAMPSPSYAPRPHTRIALAFQCDPRAAIQCGPRLAFAIPVPALPFALLRSGAHSPALPSLRSEGQVFAIAVLNWSLPSPCLTALNHLCPC